ncbi:MAG: hypothetical protein GY855_15010, partial [candidate division Zixibacteria bacterium]|nr:hypothetical protein [candidate division Zixibacteria bacterium]
CGEFFHWELATIISAHRLQINPFDQPNVESAKIAAKEMMKSYAASGSLPELTPAIDDGYTKVYTDIEADNPKDALKMFVNRFERGAKDGKGRSYVSIQAFVKPDSEIDKVLQKLRTTIQTKYRLATTVGYGPRFLHSTGQLHKGDSGNGLFIQFTTDNPIDTPIPDEPGSNSSSMSFGILIHAQALGDRQALLDNGRKAIRFHFRDDIASGIKDLAEQL